MWKYTKTQCECRNKQCWFHLERFSIYERRKTKTRTFGWGESDFRDAIVRKPLLVRLCLQPCGRSRQINHEINLQSLEVSTKGRGEKLKETSELDYVDLRRSAHTFSLQKPHMLQLTRVTGEAWKYWRIHLLCFFQCTCSRIKSPGMKGLIMDWIRTKVKEYVIEDEEALHHTETLQCRRYSSQ